MISLDLRLVFCTDVFVVGYKNGDRCSSQLNLLKFALQRMYTHICNYNADSFLSLRLF